MELIVGLVNSSSGTVTMTEGTISNIDDGIVVSNSGVFNIKGGILSSSSDRTSSNSITALSNSSTGVVNIGVKGDGDVSISSPTIKAECSSLSRLSYGIVNTNGIINFYDGIIQGKTKFGNGGITNVEEGYQIKEAIIDDLNSIYLEPIEEINVVRNEITRQEYIKIQDAIDDVKDNEETILTILDDFNLKTNFEIPESKNIIIDLAGKIITNNYISIRNSGKCNIKDSVGGGKINCNGTKSGINNLNYLSINNLEINITDINNTAYAVYNQKNGVLTMDNVTLTSVVTSDKNSNDVYGIYNEESEMINIKNSTIMATSNNCNRSYAIYNGATGGEIKIENTSLVAIGNKYTRYTNGIYNASNATITIIDVDIDCEVEKIDSSDSYTAGIYNNANGIINVKNGSINCNAASISVYGIYNKVGNINIENIIVSCANTRNFTTDKEYGIYNSSTGKINIENGTISGMGPGYGIYNSSTGIINIGIKGDGIVSKTMPEISTLGTGIYNPKGMFYFYDGIIKGTKIAVEANSLITEIEENATLLYENDNTILTLATEAVDIAKIGNITYSNLQEAIDAAGTNQTTIELLRGIQFTVADSAITVANNQNIILDLKGFSIISAIEDEVLKNNGTLKITDSSENVTGKILGSADKVIYNTQGAILELDKCIITRKIAKDSVIYNEGTLNVTSSTIIQPDNEDGYSIYNTETAQLNIIDGQIKGGIRGIYNAGNAKITNGTITRGIENAGSGYLEIENMMCTYEVTNKDNASLKMIGGTIEYSSVQTSIYGIKNTSTNSVDILGGIINVSVRYYGPCTGIYTTAGTLNIGKKDGIINQEPIIIGDYGVRTSSILNIYDGIIKSNYYDTILGEISEIEEQSDLVIGKEDTYKTISIISVDTPLAEVGTNQYYSLKEAIDNISEIGTVKILREGTVEHTINNLSGKNITLDLNGNNLKMYTKIENTGTLTITDTSELKTGNLYSYKDSPIYNTGTLTIEEGTISGNTYGIYNQTGGILEVIGGNISNNTYGIYTVGGIANITEGNINNNTYGIYIDSGSMDINGGIIANNTYGIYNSKASINIISGRLETNNYAIYNNASAAITNISAENIVLTGNTNDIYNVTGTVNVISGTIETTNGVLIENASSGTIIVGTEDGTVSTEIPTIQAEEYAIKNSGNGTIKFYDGAIKGKIGAIQGLYLYLETGYTFKTDYVGGYYCDTLTPSGTVSTVAKIGTTEYGHLQAAINACVSEETQTITLVNSINTEVPFIIEEGQNIIIDLNGKHIISSTAESTIQNAGNLTIIDSSTQQTGKVSNSYDVAINNSGTLTIGQDDETVNEGVPVISGKTNAIINTGIFNFYDGIIESTGTVIDGTITDRPEGYIIISQNVDGVQQLVLSK